MTGRLVLALLAALGVLGILACAALALFGNMDMLCIAMKDDGFYYLTLARNIAAGFGATFDRIAPTNGFHPLWTMVLTPLFWIAGESLMTPVRLTMLLAIVIQLAGAWAVARAARRFTSPFAARVAGLFYLANPVGLYLVVSGMESALVGLLVALLAGESIRTRLGDDVLVDRHGIVRVGLLCGLAALARTDTILLAGLVLLGALLVPPAGGTAMPVFSRLRRVGAAGCVMAAALAPWLIWNLARFGTIVQVSARSHRLHAVTNRAGGESGGIERTLRVSLSLAEGLLRQLGARTHLPPAAVALILLAGLAVFAAWIAGLLRERATRTDLVRALRVLDAPLLYAAGFLFATFVILGHIRSWYVAGPLAVGALLVALPAHFGWGSERASRGVRLLSRLILVAVILGHAILAPAYTREIVTSARTPFVWREAAAWAAEHTAPGDRVASFNSGSFGYLSSRTVVNLDCVVNNPGMRALEERRLLEFLRDWKIRYVLDDPGYVSNYMRAYGGEDWGQVVAPVDTLRARMRVYEVRPR
jgi:hypothetical protein